MEKKRIVISGINGFVGHHLANKLTESGMSVIGIGREASINSAIEHIVDEYHVQDITAGWPAIDNVDGVIHLAGLASVGDSFGKPQQYISANSAMVTNLCEYYLSKEERPRLLVISSSSIYSSNQAMPLTEASEFGFTSPYSISKILVENQAAYYRNRGLDCIIARPFNHTGPGQGKGFILPDLFEQLSSMNPSQSAIQVGNLRTKRDYTDVRDIVDAYTKLIMAPSLKHTVYNICSGVSLAGEDILHILKNTIGKGDVQFEIDPSRVRPTDPAEFYGDPSRIQEELNWTRTHSINDTIEDFVASKRDDSKE
jgi:GDP-4-dehydro-6-deoxy-D-mannose reductase